MRTGGSAHCVLEVGVVADRPAAADQICRALRDCGHVVRRLPSLSAPPIPCARGRQPSALVLRTTADDERQNAAFAAAAAGSPVVLLSPTASEQALGLAAESGAIVHLVEPVTTQALAAAVRLAVARAGDRRAAANELAKLRQSAASRELVERAKTILMTRFGFSEEEAHRRLQTESRIRNRKVAETAWHVIQADARLRGPRRYETAR